MKRTRRMLAVDLGASGGKCFVGELRGSSFKLTEIHRFAHEGVSFFTADRHGRVAERTHWDDTLLYQEIITGLRTYRREVSDKLDTIGIDTWGADGCMFTADGDPLGKIYCYRDHRLDSMVEAVKARMDAGRIYRITGVHFQPFNVSNQLHWLALNRPGMFGRGCFFLPVPSVFYYYLGGVKVVDSSWASVTQLMDARKRQWSKEVLRKLRIPERILPGIVKPGSVVGSLLGPLARSIGLSRAGLVFVASHDTASAFAAAPVGEPEESLIISSGTWSLVGKLVAGPVTSDKALAANLSNEGGIGNVRLLKNCMGTWLVQELRREWRNADGREMKWEEMTDLAMKAERFAALIDPDDLSFYNPASMSKAMAAYCKKTGQKAPSGRGGLLRCVYESLALKYRRVNEDICGATGTSTKQVNIVGGGSKNRMLNQFTADALGVPVFAGPEEATAVGNLMTQAMGLREIRTMKDAMPIIRASFPIAAFRPNDPSAWNSAFERFCALKPR